jgi:hypothetical protein
MQETRTAAKTVLHGLLAVGVDEPEVLRSRQVRKRETAILARVQETAEPDFGGLAEAQYIAMVIANAKANYRLQVQCQLCEL